MTKHRKKKWRLYQFLVACGVVKSKSEAADLAHSKRVCVNGKVMESLHFQIHPFKDDVRIDGKKIAMKENRRYFMLNKPQGIVTTKENILSFLQNIVPAEDLHSFFPIGRLDKDTTGLLIVTNDGRIGKRVLNPKTKRTKVYETCVKGNVTPKELDILCNGVDIDICGQSYTTLPAVVKVITTSHEDTVLHISIIEGKKRQVRKMCNVIGHPVKQLKRISIAKLILGLLSEGNVKEYTKEEMYRLLFE